MASGLQLGDRLLSFAFLCCCIATPRSALAQVIDEGIGVGQDCVGSAVNDFAVVVGSCTKTEGITAGFASLSPGTSVELPHLAIGRSCDAGAISNNGLVVGSCNDVDSVSQAVKWTDLAGTPTVQQLRPLGGDVKTVATAFNQDGAIAGVSISGVGTSRPVLWKAGTTNAIALPVGLLGLSSSNCSPTDVVAGSGTGPTVVGMCPDGRGKSRPMYWSPTGLLGAYVAALYAHPEGSDRCAVFQQISTGGSLGTCGFGLSGARTTYWQNPATPLVLTITDGAGRTLRNSGIDMNASGQVLGQVQLRDEPALPFVWDTRNNNFTVIAPLPGGFSASGVAIGNNGLVLINSETEEGNLHSAMWTYQTGTVDLPPISGGDNSSATNISKNGCHGAGESEVVGHEHHATEIELCSQIQRRTLRGAKPREDFKAVVRPGLSRKL
ncbi:HAF repeat-containing protein [Lysobacter antibioticus]|uniref:HAF repeat-containing protein n=1 Tax=Lysobacter antibioticus TaxID=84531 RepID=UPI001269AB04|nr:HAF repeat-containing protein [Lysobacter antibioticus]